MPRPPHNRDAFLRAIHALRLADLEMLYALLRSDGFGKHAIERTADVFGRERLISTFWHRLTPRNRFGSARRVFALNPSGAKRIGLSDLESARCERLVRFFSTSPERIKHDLMIGRFHAALMIAERKHPEHIRLAAWEQGQGTQILDGRRRLITPDARFLIELPSTKRKVWYFLEADTASERLDSHSNNHRTIRGKVRRYDEADSKGIAQRQFGDMKRFRVLFVVPRRFDPAKSSEREDGVLEMFRQYGFVDHHDPGFFRVMSETDVFTALTQPDHLFTDAQVSHLNDARESVVQPLFVGVGLSSTEPARYAQPAEPVA